MGVTFVISEPKLVTRSYSCMLQKCECDIIQNSIEVDAETKDSTRKTEEKLDGRYKEGHERKKPK